MKSQRNPVVVKTMGLALVLAGIVSPVGDASGAIEVRIMAGNDVDIERKSSAALGEPFRGGICAESGGCDDAGGDLVVSSYDGNKGYYGTNGYVTGATSSSDGYTNTDTVVAAVNDGNGSYNPPGYTPNAPRTCWHKTANGFADWYLPALDELQSLYDNLNGVIAFRDGQYWSSTENTSTTAYRLHFGDGGVDDFGKGERRNVRCVRRVN